MTFQQFPGASIREIRMREAANYLANTETPAILIDVRERDEYLPRHAHHAVNIPMSEFIARIAEVPQDQDVLVICEHGPRSTNVVRYLMRQGYTQVINVDGGTEMWESAGLPMDYPKHPKPLATSRLPASYHAMSRVTAPVCLHTIGRLVSLCLCAV